MVRYAVAVLVLLGTWEAGALCLGSHLLPAPLETLDFFLGSLARPEFLAHVGASLGRVLAGLALAWITAFPLGLLLGHVRRADRWLSPLLFLTYPIPKIVLLPVFLVLFGLGDPPRVLLIAMTSGYQIAVVVRAAARHLDPRHLDSFRSLKGTRTQLVRHVLVPAVLPEALTALRVATGTAVAVLFMAESFATTSGLGFLIMDAWGRGDQLEMFAGITAMSLMGVVLYEGCNLLERLLCPWKGRRV